MVVYLPSKYDNYLPHELRFHSLRPLVSTFKNFLPDSKLPISLQHRVKFFKSSTFFSLIERCLREQFTNYTARFEVRTVRQVIVEYSE